VAAWWTPSIGEYIVVLAVAGAIGARGYVSGMVIGLMASVILFAINYSRIEQVRQVEFGSTYRSNVDRPEAERQVLRELADEVVILQINGFVFFGVASGLVERIRKQVEAGSLRYLLIDLRRATGMDSSAVVAFRKVAGLAQASGFELVFTGGPEAVLSKLGRGGIDMSNDGALRFEPDLDHGLQRAEEGLLAGRRVASPKGWGDVLSELSSRLGDFIEREDVPQGTVLIRQGEPSDDLFVLESGRLSVEATMPDGARMRLTSVSPGVMVGEIAFYLGGPRTADVVAEVPSAVVRLSRSAIERLEREAPEAAADLHRRLAQTLAERARDSMRAQSALLD
jgi:sulfate permease, SulP family